MPKISDVSIREIGIPPIRSVFTGLPQPIINDVPVPVTVTIGSPIVNIPGCIEANLDGPGLVDDDPNGNVVFCDGQTPSFNPINYNPEEKPLLTGPPEPKAPKLENEQKETEETENLDSIPQTPQLPTPKIPEITIPSCKEDEEYNEQLRVCVKIEKEETVEVVEEPTFVEQYLPSAKEVTTTVTIAVAAASAAVFGKPLAELILKLIKPAVKQVVNKIQKKLGKKDIILSVSERRQLQRDLRK